VIYSLLSSRCNWSFKDDEVPVHGRFLVNSPDGIRSAVLDGLGIGYAPAWLFEDALAYGGVQALLLDHPGAPGPIQIVFPDRRLCRDAPAASWTSSPKRSVARRHWMRAGLGWIMKRSRGRSSKR
jgi:DNA-binding transcriptional LysR family regulator